VCSVLVVCVYIQLLYDIYISILTSVVILEFLYVNRVPLTFNDVHCLNDNAVLAVRSFKQCALLYMWGILNSFSGSSVFCDMSV